MHTLRVLRIDTLLADQKQHRGLKLMNIILFHVQFSVWLYSVCCSYKGDICLSISEINKLENNLPRQFTISRFSQRHSKNWTVQQLIVSTHFMWDGIKWKCLWLLNSFICEFNQFTYGMHTLKHISRLQWNMTFLIARQIISNAIILRRIEFIV